MSVLLKLKDYWIHLLLLIISFCYLAVISQQRLIARDEGFYLFASQLVVEGHKTYLDFFYPQMPMLPLIYGLFFKIFGVSWENARLLNAFFASCLGITIFSYLKLKFRLSYALFGLFLFLFSNYTIAWLSVSQTYAPSLLCLLISFYYLTRGNLTKVDVLTAAGFLAYAIQIRLFFIALVPFYLGKLLINSKIKPEKTKDCLRFIAILVLFSLPTLSLAWTNWDNFYFNNLGYHLDRSNLTPTDTFENKIQVGLVALGLTPTVKFSAWQLPALIYCSFCSAILILLKEKTIPLAFLLLITLFILNLIPNPAYVQYFATLLPFAIIGTITLLNLIPQKAIRVSVVILLLGIYIYKLPADYLRHLRTGENLIGIMTQDQANHYNLKNLRKIRERLQIECDSKEMIIGYWPGYLVGTPCQAYPGTENHFGIQIAEKLSPEKQQKYSVINNERIKQAITAGSAPLVLLGKREENNQKIRKLVNLAGYKSIWKNAGVEIFRKSS